MESLIKPSKELLECVKGRGYSLEHLKKHGKDQESELHEFLEKH